MTNIIIDRNIRHGKPTIKGTRITVNEVLNWLESGMDYDEIEHEYDLTKEKVLAALEYAPSEK